MVEVSLRRNRNDSRRNSLVSSRASLAIAGSDIGDADVVAVVVVVAVVDVV